MSTIHKPSPPAGMVEVSKDDFFALLKADPRDIMPSVEAPTYSTWRVVSTRAVWGWTAPGWRNPSEHEKVFAVVKGVQK